MADEEAVSYRDIPGFVGYRVGSDGSVWSNRVPFKNRPGDSWRLLKQTIRTDGYRVVGIRRPDQQHRSGKVTILYVHRLVLESFVGRCPDGMEGCHTDDDRANNCLGNLRWDTRAANYKDSVRNGRAVMGGRNPNAKLMEEDIPLVRLLRGRGFYLYRIAALFDVSVSLICDILAGRVWKHVPAEHVAAVRKLVELGVLKAPVAREPFPAKCYCGRTLDEGRSECQTCEDIAVDRKARRAELGACDDL